jgi:hypothetical protein
MIALQRPRSGRRQAWRITVTFGAVLAVVASFAFDVEAASCGSYPQDIRAAIKKHVETLRALEREAADRLKGLDTRTFDYLLGQARAVAGVIADKDALAAEEELSRCSESIPPVRRVCAEAAQALVSLIEARAAGATDKAPKQVYAQAMPQCERWMDFLPLTTVFRTLD